MAAEAARLADVSARAATQVRVVPTLATARLTLRPLRHADAPAIFGFFSDPVVMRYGSRPTMTHLSQARRVIRDVRAGYRRGDLIQLGLERKDTGALVGTCTLFHFHTASRRAEIGYALGHVSWGQGYMHEALTRLIAYAFDDLALHRIEADIDPDNAASARTLLRQGFVREGRLRERWIVGDTISDSEMYGLLRHEWVRSAATS